MADKVVGEPLQARRGLDFVSAVYVSATARHQQETFDFCCSLVEEFGGSADWREAGRSQHFGRCFTHLAGGRLELTEIDGGAGRNPGMTLLSLSGSAFYLQESDAVMLMLWKLVTQDGFKWFTRLDFMSTELQPEWDMERVYQGVVGGQLWVKGHRTYEPRGELAQDGSCPTGRTIYWGSPRSERRCRTYDKGKEAGWSEPAIRDEVQLRGDWAKTYGRELRQLLRAPGGSAAMAAAVEGLTVKAVNQHLQYWDLNGADPVNDRNWMRKAKPADWFAERIGKPSAPLRKPPKELRDNESTVDWVVTQGGRSCAIWVEHHARRLGVDREFVVMALYNRFFSRLRPEDFVQLGLAETPEELIEADAFMRQLQDELAVAGERGWWADE